MVSSTLPAGIAFAHGVIAVIGAIEIVVGISMCRPWARLKRPSPQLVMNNSPRDIQHHHRMHRRD